MILIRSVLFNALFFGLSVIIVIGLCLTLPLPRAVLSRGLRAWMQVTMAILKLVVGLNIDIRGRDNVPPGPALFASKHQSAWDTGIYFMILDDPSYVLKKELLSIPFYGWLLRKDEMVAIDRDGGAGALKHMVRDSRAILDSGRKLVVFPEGTRSHPGQKMPYHPGIAAIYKQAAVPVIPVALNSGLFWGRRAFAKNPGTIVLEFLEPMAMGLDRKPFMAELENRVEVATNRLIAEAAGNVGNPVDNS